MKYCEIFKTNEEYKILTHSISKDGFGMISCPISVISCKSKQIDIFKQIDLCLKNSTNDAQFPNSKEEYKLYVNNILEKLNEKSLDSFYKKSKGCMLELDNDNNLTIKPYVFLNPKKTKEGLIYDENKIEQFDYSERVIDKLIEIINIQHTN
jgi:hypothetical protein